MSITLKKTLAATLAASIATGMAAVPAMAETTVDADALYAAAYNATIKAKDSGLQADINAAREAIAALEGTGAAFAIGEFSKIVDAPQQAILTKIVDGILAQNAAETPDQAKINEIRDMIVTLPNKDWKNDYSSALDKAQQKLIDNAVKAVEKAEKSGLQADIDAAIKLLDTLKTATNNEGVVAWANAFKLEVEAKLGELKVNEVKVLNSTSIKVDFNKVVNADTVDADDFVVAKSTDENAKQLVKGIKVSDDKKSVEVELYSALEKGNYDVTVSGIKAENGKEVEAYKGTVTYATATIASVELPSTITFKHTDKVEGSDLSKFVTVKDSEGRVITNEVKLSFTTNNEDVVTTNGVINKVGKAKVTVTATKGEDKVSTGTIDLEIKQNGTAVETTYQGFTLSTEAVDSVYSKLEKKNTTIKEGETVDMYLFHKDQYGTEIKGEKATIVENLSTAVRVVDGQIKGEKAGTAKLKVEVVGENDKKIEKIVTFEVKAASVTKGIEVQSEVKLAAGVNESYAVKKVDQYGEKVALAGDIKVEYLDGTKVLDATKDAEKIAKIKETVIVDVSEGNVTVDAKAETKSTVGVRVTYTEGTGTNAKKFTKDMKITVAGTNDVKDYKVSLAGDKVLDKADAKDKLDITVAGTNANGAVVELSDATIKVFNSKNEDVTSNFMVTRNTTNKTLVGKNAENGKYKVVVSHGTYTVETFEIEVVDTTAVAKTIKFNTNAITVSSRSEIESAIKAKISVKDQYGKDVEVKEFTVVGGYEQNVKDDSFDLVITKVNVNGADIAVNHQVIRVTVK